jgi:hypothetical protein
MKRQKITKPSKVLMGTFVLLVTFCGWHSMPCVAQWRLNVAKLERSRVLKAANDFLKEAPITITASVSPRSAGGVHDFFLKVTTGGPIHRIRMVLTSNAMGCRTQTTLSTTGVI